MSNPVSSALNEEIARAELYGLLAQLYYQSPTPSVLQTLRTACSQIDRTGTLLEKPWHELIAAAQATSQAEVASEYATLFGGVGKPEIYLYGSHYLAGFLNERPLVRLRTDLAALGLARVETMEDTEDHIAYLCEVMRFLITDTDSSVANLSCQKKFFSTHLQPWVGALCDAIASHPQAHFYRSLASFTSAFIEIETQAFDLL